MEKSPGYELSERRDVDNLQLISGSVASPPEVYSRIDRKEAQRSNCMIYCCILSVAVIAVLALCAAVAAIILVAAFPNVTNPAVQEVLVLKDQLTAQLASTSTPSAANSNEELQRIRETLENSLTSIDTKLEASISSIGSILERLVAVQENGTCEAPPEPLLGTAANPARYCRDISADLPSGDYWIQPDGASCPIRVYCDLDGSACSCRCDTEEGGWMRVANLDMTDPNQNCPDGFTQVNTNNPPLRLCGRPGPAGCSSIFFPVNGIEYSRVCGRATAYVFGSPDGFIDGVSLESHYVDGMSISYGSPRNHIWTFVSSWKSTSDPNGCPCDTNNYQGTVPSFVGNNYFCESTHNTQIFQSVSTDTPLWDGGGCLDTSSCCLFNNPPFFCKTLDAPTTDDIEVRLCGNQENTNEDAPFERVEMYVY